MKQYPELKLDGLKVLTDETGILQHTKYSIIDKRQGYTTDDNARALIAALRYHKIYNNSEALDLAHTYLTFLLFMQNTRGAFHNVLGFDRTYRDKVGSEDSNGRTIWATGYTLVSNATKEMKQITREMFDRGLPTSRGFKASRAKAFTIIGLADYYSSFPSDKNIFDEIEVLAGSLASSYKLESSANWRWFEPQLTYCNARLPQALFMAYSVTENRSYLDVAEESMDFLVQEQFTDDIFRPVGSKGWYHKGKRKAQFDQQPIEASCMVEAAVSALKCTGNYKYRDLALKAFDWYHGCNTGQVSLLKKGSFRCYDGITSKGLNQNSGAESTISYYLAHLLLKENHII
ncbi:glycosyltransferase [Candidatus Bathyarchaeota archaeon]|nr:MAG: glycosyltransferase [Candidatus Bathyarchaeota archaeon]